MRPIRPLARGCTALALAATLHPFLGAQDQVSGVTFDPFQPGVRWIHAAEIATPWIPDSVEFAAEGRLVWAARGWTNPGLMLLSAEEGPGASPLHRVEFPHAVAPPVVRGGHDASHLYAAVQEAHPAGGRRTRIERYDALAAARGAAFTPRWTHEFAFGTPGPAWLGRVRADGDLIAAAWDPNTSELVVEFLDGTSGLSQGGFRFQSGIPREFESSADGGRIAWTADRDAWVVDEHGQVLHHDVLPFPTHALALSGDGRTLAVGRTDHLAVLRDTGGGFSQIGTLPTKQGEIVQRADLSDDGTVVAVACWDAQGGRDVRLEVRGDPNGAPWLEWTQSGSAGDPQNLPEVLRLSADGTRVALGLWGLGDTQAEALIFGTRDPQPRLALDLPGSVHDLALDPMGRRIAVASKAAHRNQFDIVGTLHLAGTGEADVQVLAGASPGGALEVAAQRSGAQGVLFLVGSPAAQGQALPGIGGSLLIDRSRRLRILARPADAQGRAELQLSLPTSLGLVAYPLAVQAAFRVGGGLELSSERVGPLIL